MAVYSTNEFKSGMKILLDGDPYSILENEYVKPGKGQAFNRVRVRNLKTGRVVELAIGEQSRVRYDRRSTKLEHQAAVKAEPQNIATRFIHRVRHDGSINGLQC